jgi:hypothetical protein
MDTDVKVYCNKAIGYFYAKIYMFGMLVHQTEAVDNRRDALGDARDWLMNNS